MNQEVITQDQQQGSHPATAAALSRSLQLNPAVNAGAVAIEVERAIAEAQGQMTLAKKFPRDMTAAHAELMQACSIKAFAETAFYSVPNRGSGPSIRFAEEVARVCGNFQYGHRELSRADGKSEVEVFAWDMEKNNFSKRQITVMHITDTKNGPKILKDQTDIDNKIANVASKQMRGRILALLPKWLVADAIEKCKNTIAGNSDEPMAVRVRKMTQAFAKFGVNEKNLAEYVKHSLDDINLDELVDLQGVYNALKDGAKVSDYFGNKEAEAESSANTAGKLANSAKAGEAAAPAKGAARKAAATTATATAQEQADKQQPAETSQQKPAEQAGSTSAQIDSNSAEKESTSTEEQVTQVTNSNEAGGGESVSGDDDQPVEEDQPLF